MAPIELGPARAVGAISARLTRTAGGEEQATIPGVSTRQPDTETPAVAPTSPVQTSGALDAGEAPVEADRVAVIRKAVESGTYPVIPTRIADAIIAAGVLLRSPK